MQTIYLDISNKGVIPSIYAKQKEVGRKFLAVITDGGVPYEIKSDSVISVWYEGASGSGNYTDVGEKPAISVFGNKITIELIEQMLANAGDGILTVLINSVNGEQIGLWNISYSVEKNAGAESEKAEEYYTAFSESAASLAESAKTIGEAQKRIDSIIKAKNATAAGLIYPLASENVPSGFLLCDGAEYSRTDYEELFEAIGTIYGDGNGSTTFNVPNLSTRVPVGSGDDYALGAMGGEAEHKLTVDEMPSHDHKIQVANTNTGSLQADATIRYNSENTSFTGDGVLTKKTGGGQPHNIMQPYTVVNYIISTGKEIEFIVGGTGSGAGIVESAVLYTPQTLTPKKQAQARENIGAAKASVFYGNLADAIAEQNAVAESTAPIEVFTAENGEKIVRLLADVSESAQIDITTDMTIMLNGHTLNLTTAAAYLNFAEGTNCTINGVVEGSAIKKENITATGSCYVINTAGKITKVIGGYYSVSGSLSKASVIFKASASCKHLEIDGAEMLSANMLTTITAADKCIQSQASFTAVRNSTLTANALKAQAVHIVAPSGQAVICDCEVTANSSQTTNTNSVASPLNLNAISEVVNSTFYASGYSAIAVQTNGNSVIKNSHAFADAHSGHVGQSRAIGIRNDGALVCIDTNVIGTHSAVESYGDLHVKGGTFSGYTHGGFYLVHGAEHNAYINNAVMRFGVYEGNFDDFEACAYAGFYVGQDELDSPGISAYMDGCTIEGQGNEVGVVRAGAVGTTNTLYISNTLNNSTARSIRLNKDQTTNRAEMKIGMGCNFTTANANDPQWAEETGKLYRRMKDDMPMDGRDFTALAAYLNKE